MIYTKQAPSLASDIAVRSVIGFQKFAHDSDVNCGASAHYYITGNNQWRCT